MRSEHTKLRFGDNCARSMEQEGGRIMDTQKAIEYFSGKLEKTLSNRRRKAYEVALEALGKQNTAKEVKEDWGPFGTIIVCPECLS